MGNKNNAGHFCALITIIIWGTTFISRKVLLVGLFLSESKISLRKEVNHGLTK